MKLLNIFVIIILGTSLTEWIEGKPNICHYITTIDEFGKVKWMKSGTNCDIVTFGGVKQTKSEPTTFPGIGDSTEASTVGHSLEVSSKEDSTEDETTQTTTDRIGDSTEASTVGHSLEVSSKEDSTEDVTTQTTDHCTSCDWKTIGNSSYCLIHRPSVTWDHANRCCKSISNNSHLACFGSFDESNHVYNTFDLTADVNIWGDCSADTTFACEDNRVAITCDHEHSINIRHALYGRMHDREFCSDAMMRIHEFKCNSTNSYKVVNDTCQDKITCIVTADSATFNNDDPCRGTFKYLEVAYECVPEDMTQGACRRFIITESETYITQTDDCSNNDINDVLCEQSIDA